MTTHSTQSLNKCSICLKNYKRIQDLNRHKKLEHSTIDSVLVTPSFGMDSYSRSLFERNIMLERQVKMLEEELSIERAKLRRLTLNGGDFCNVDYDVLRSGIQY